MKLDYKTLEEVKIYKKEYIDKIIEDFTYMEEVKNMKSVRTPSAEYLFMMNPNPKKLYEEKADVFHTTIY